MVVTSVGSKFFLPQDNHENTIHSCITTVSRASFRSRDYEGFLLVRAENVFSIVIRDVRRRFAAEPMSARFYVIVTQPRGIHSSGECHPMRDFVSFSGNLTFRRYVPFRHSGRNAEPPPIRHDAASRRCLGRCGGTASRSSENSGSL